MLSKEGLARKRLFQITILPKRNMILALNVYLIGKAYMPLKILSGIFVLQIQVVVPVLIKQNAFVFFSLAIVILPYIDLLCAECLKSWLAYIQ